MIGPTPPTRPSFVAATALLVAVSTAALAPATASSHDVLQPGDSLGGFCTLNFVFDGSGGDAYIGTAGHCVDDGQRVSNPDLGTFGTVVYDNDSSTDFALVDVDDALEGKLDASLDGHGGTPTGVATPDETAPGDALLMSGYGVGAREAETTREERRSVLVEHGSQEYQSDGPVVNGDSGAPLVHAPTGEALGIVSRYGIFEIPPTTDVGPTLDRILDVLQQDGYDVTLRTT
jgi:hypothetical protein